MMDKFLGLQILPDQMQVINPALVLFLIPVFDRILYPCLIKHRLLENPLHRMAVGGIIAGLAFLTAGVVELILERNYPVFPGKHHAAINFVNSLPCDITIYSPFASRQHLNASERYVFSNIEAHGSTIYNVSIEADSKYCGNVEFTKDNYMLTVLAVEYQVRKLFLLEFGCWQRCFLLDRYDYNWC